MPTIFEKLSTAGVTKEDIRRELRILREAVRREPDLAPLLDDFPDDEEDIGDLEAPDETGLVVLMDRGELHTVPMVLLAAKVNKLSKHDKGQKALAARQREFNRMVSEHVAKWESAAWNTDELRRALRDEIKGLHISSAVSGKGFKWADMTFSDWGRVGNEIRKQYGFLDRRIQSVNEGRKTGKALRADLGKFAEAGSASYERAAVSRTGFPVDILPTVPGAGDTDCLTRCKCFWHIRTLSTERGDFDVSWRLGKAEHCNTCRKRGQRAPSGWAGLKVRNFRWQTLPAQIYRNRL